MREKGSPLYFHECRRMQRSESDAGKDKEDNPGDHV